MFLYIRSDLQDFELCHGTEGSDDIFWKARQLVVIETAAKERTQL